MEKATATFAKLKAYSPAFNGPVPTKDAIESILTVMNKASIEDGYGGDFVSHNGDKQWL